MVHRDNGRASIGMTELLVTAPLARRQEPRASQSSYGNSTIKIGITANSVRSTSLQSTIPRLPEDYRWPGPAIPLDSPLPLLNSE